MSVFSLQKDKPDQDSLVFHHMVFHPRDPPARVFQLLFWRFIIQPINEPHIYDVRNIDGVRVQIDRLILAYHNPKTLRNLFFPRKFAQEGGFEVSNFS